MRKKPGRNSTSSPFRKRELSSDAKILVTLINKPQTKKEICQETKMNDRTFYRNISILEEKQKIIKCEDSSYALWNFNPLKKQIENAFIKFQKKPFIGTSSISSEVGIPWREIETVTCKVAKERGLTKGSTDGINTCFYDTSKEEASK